MFRALFILVIALCTSATLVASGSLPVTGEAVVMVVPDQVIVTIGIEMRQPQLAAAKAQHDAIATRVTAAIAGLGIKPEQVRTDCLEIAPYYHDGTATERLVPEYYRINRTLVVTLSLVTQVDALLSEVLTAGATHVHNVEFRTTQLRKHRDEARRLAIRAAHDKATMLAGEMEQTVGKAIAISEAHIGWYGYNAYRSRDSRVQYQSQNATASDGSDEVVPPGQIAVRASISVTFALN